MLCQIEIKHINIKQAKTIDRVFSFIDQFHSFNSRQIDISPTLIILKISHFGKNDSWKMEVLRNFCSWDQDIDLWFTNPDPLIPTLSSTSLQIEYKNQKTLTYFELKILSRQRDFIMKKDLGSFSFFICSNRMHKLLHICWFEEMTTNCFRSVSNIGTCITGLSLHASDVKNKTSHSH